jgi:hypothetical protein
MPFAAAAPLIASLAGPLIGAVAGGQGPRGSTGQFNEKQIIDMLTQSTSQQSGSQSNRGFNQAIEDPRFSAFRSGLLPMFGQEMNRVQQPIFGEAEKAGALQDINAQFAGVNDRVAQSTAARGQLGSGLLPQLELQGELGAASQRANFLSSLPMLEENARRQSTGALLGQGMNFAGRAPISHLTGSDTAFEQFAEGQEHRTGTTQRQGNQAQQFQQPPLWQRLLGAGAGILGNPTLMNNITGGIGNLIPGGAGTGNFPMANPNGAPQQNFSIMAPDISFDPGFGQFHG